MNNYKWCVFKSGEDGSYKAGQTSLINAYNKYIGKEYNAIVMEFEILCDAVEEANKMNVDAEYSLYLEEEHGKVR